MELGLKSVPSSLFTCIHTLQVKLLFKLFMNQSLSNATGSRTEHVDLQKMYSQVKPNDNEVPFRDNWSNWNYNLK